MSNEENQKKWSQLVKRAWADESLKNRLLTDPTPLLLESGIEIPPGVEAPVVADKDSVSCLVQPRKPASDVMELTPSELSGVVGGGAKVGGGGKAQPVVFLEIKMEQVVITS